MKNTLLATALIVALTAGFAYAHGGWGHGKQNGYGMMGKGMRGDGNNWNCPGRNGAGGADWQGSDQQQTFLNETATLRKQLNDKRFELREASRNPESTAEQLGSLQKEMIDLRTQIGQKAQQLQDSAQ